MYLDGFPVASHSEEQHRAHLRALFVGLRKYGATIAASKCKLGQPGMNLSKHIASFSDMAPLPDKIIAIRQLLSSTNTAVCRLW